MFTQSETIMNVEEYPGEPCYYRWWIYRLEFAATYTLVRYKITVIDVTEAFLPREDDDVAQAVKRTIGSFRRYFQPRRSVKAVHQEGGKVVVKLQRGEGAPVAFTTDAVLVATGRRANDARFKI